MDEAEQLRSLDELLEESSEESSNDDTRRVRRASNINYIFDSSLSSDDSWESDGYLFRDPNESDNFMQKILTFTDIEFKTHMKMERTTVAFLIERYSTSAFPQLGATRNRGPVSYEKEIYMYTWYIANTLNMQHLSILFNITKLTAWVAMRRVCRWLNSISNEFIKWPTMNKVEENTRNFELLYKIPDVIGVIECFHINIRPPSFNKESYWNRESEYTIILQIVADTDNNLLDISCGEPGSLYDNRVLRRSELFRKVTINENNMFPKNTYLLGGIFYVPVNWLIPPYKDYGNLTDCQKSFNRIHTETRKPAQMIFTMLKSRFIRFRHLHELKSLSSVNNLIKSMCVLHNICLSLHDDVLQLCENDNYGIVIEPTRRRNSNSTSSSTQPDTCVRRNELFTYLQEKQIL